MKLTSLHNYLDLGIYIHIPFCKQACNYCDFHFSTSLKHKQAMINAIINELKLRKNELDNKEVKTIYFGGGTPSLLTKAEVNLIFTQINSITQISNNCEITLEANPDDLSKKKINEFKNTPINRFSIGVQSFFNDDLRWMNRAHNADEAISSIKYAQDNGFDNLTIDLIFGAPTTSNEMWMKNLQLWNELQIPHLSAYNLTVENNTALAHAIKSGKTKPLNDEQFHDQFSYLMQFAKNNHIEQYEISNYAKNKQYAKHNTNYWFNKQYVGIGPSAHSYNGSNERSWNISNNIKYIQGIENGTRNFGMEELTKADQVNEYLLTRLRTKWGINQQEFINRFGKSYWQKVEVEINKQLNSNHLIKKNNSIILSKQAKYIADELTARLFIE